MNDRELIYLGLASRIEEVNVEIKDPKLEIVAVEPSSGQRWTLLGLPTTGHRTRVFKVTLKHGGEEFALDLTSAQFGHFEPIVPWSTYLTIAEVQSYQYFGATKAYAMQQRWAQTILATNINLHAEASRTLLMGIIKWESGQKATFQSIFRNPLVPFESYQTGLIKYLEEELQKHLVYIKGELEAFKMCKLQGGTYTPPRDFWTRKTLPIIGKLGWPSAVNNKKPAKRAFKVTK